MPSRSLVAFAIVAALAAPHAAADATGDELARLREEAAQLRQSLNRLDARIQVLESQAPGPSLEKNAVPAAPPVAVAPASLQPIASLKQNWAQVERGVPQGRVRSLLGEPGKILRVDGSLVWYYAYPGFGRGSVFFNEDGKVSGAQSPGFGW